MLSGPRWVKPFLCIPLCSGQSPFLICNFCLKCSVLPGDSLPLIFLSYPLRRLCQIACPQNSSPVHLPTPSHAPSMCPSLLAYQENRSHQAEIPFPASKPANLTTYKPILPKCSPSEMEGGLTLKVL